MSSILARIRHCGRHGDEQEARRLYLAYIPGVDFREYRRAYRMGQNEARPGVARSGTARPGMARRGEDFMKRSCNWCKRDMGEIAPEQPGITHGICESYKTKILAEGDGQHLLSGEAESLPPFSETPRPSFRWGLRCK